MSYTREQILSASGWLLHRSMAGITPRDLEASEIIRQLLAENDALREEGRILRDALNSYIQFVDDAAIAEGQFHWLPEGNSAQLVIDAARKKGQSNV